MAVGQTPPVKRHEKIPDHTFQHTMKHLGKGSCFSTCPSCWASRAVSMHALADMRGRIMAALTGFRRGKDGGTLHPPLAKPGQRF